jgi:hypothetical protein
MMKQQLPDTLNEASMEERIIASINPLRLRELALTTRQKLYNDLLPETGSCVVSTPPRMDSRRGFAKLFVCHQRIIQNDNSKSGQSHYPFHLSLDYI